MVPAPLRMAIPISQWRSRRFARSSTPQRFAEMDHEVTMAPVRSMVHCRAPIELARKQLRCRLKLEDELCTSIARKSRKLASGARRKEDKPVRGFTGETARRSESGGIHKPPAPPLYALLRLPLQYPKERNRAPAAECLHQNSHRGANEEFGLPAATKSRTKLSRATGLAR